MPSLGGLSTRDYSEGDVMSLRSIVMVRVGNRRFSNFKEALRALGLLDATTSKERTGYSTALKAGESVTVRGIVFEPG